MLYGNDVATTHVVVYMLLYSSSTIDENNQSAHICMNHAKTLTTVKTQKLLRRIKDLGGRIFTTTSAVQAQKKICLTLSHWLKTTHVARVFYLVLICTCFWLDVNRYTCFWHLPLFISSTATCLYTN